MQNAIVPWEFDSTLRDMRSISLLCVLFAGLFSLPSAHAQSAASAAPDPYRNESLVFERYETTYRMNADGTGERIVHVKIRIQSEGAAQQLGVLTIGYASANETPHITLVRVHKPDGTTVDTPPDTAIDMPADVTRTAPLYSDLKEKHVAVRSLSVGDTLEYEVHTTIDKPEAPGEFWGSYHFTPPGTVIVLAEALTLEVPKDKYVQVWSPNHKPAITDQGNLRIYRWSAAQLVPAAKPAPNGGKAKQPPKDPDQDADGRSLPSVAWTTFHNWAEIGAWYRAMAAPRVQPTDALRARADEITHNAKTPEEQARAIYEFVSSKVRYVGIDFGVGRYQPHDAADVLANQYGDCKDKDTLLEALLRAKGFTTAPVLIGAGIAPVAEVPSPAFFNHVITTVEMSGRRVWLDSTPGVAPFGYLSPEIRDEKALVVPASGDAALVMTPAVAPYPFSERFEAQGTLDDAGRMTAKMTATYRDDFEILARALARSVAPAEWDRASQYISSITGFGGTTSNTQFKNVDDFSQPIVLTYDYDRHPFGDWENRRIIPLFPAMPFPALADDDTAPAQDIDLGSPRELTAITQIELPARYRTDLPDPVHVRTDFAVVDKTYRFDGHAITAARVIVILRKKIAKADWKSYQQFLKDISYSSEPWIQLYPPLKSIVAAPGPQPAGKGSTIVPKNGPVITIHNLPLTAAPAPAAPSASAAVPANETPGELLEKAREQIRQGDLSDAKATLDAVKAKSPQEQYLWANLGIVAEMERNYDEAKTDFRTELKYHPDNPGLVSNLAGAEMRTGNAEAARQVLKDYLARHPEELVISRQLAALQAAAQDDNAALKTLEAAAEHHPDDAALRLQTADLLARMGRKDEAAAAAQSVLADATDPGMMNDAAYILSLSGHDFAEAEAGSRKSIALLEAKSAEMTTAQANRKAFADANLLIASWDTLGWILFEEGKPDEALPFVLASWRDGLHAEVGDHLGQIYEALHRNNDADVAYRLADAAANSATPPDVREHIHESFTRLEAAGAKAGPKDGIDALQRLRTYKLGHVRGAKGWGTFRLELTADGAIEAQQMTGSPEIAAVGDAIRKMKFDDLIPPGSKAHLLRSAVVSCSQSAGCELVMVPDGGLQTEAQ